VNEVSNHCSIVVKTSWILFTND